MNPEFDPAVTSTGKLSRRSGAIWKIAIAVIVLIAAIRIVMYFFDDSPRESNRVRHPSGYSMIRPPDWDAVIQTNADAGTRDAIRLAPQHWKGLAPTIWTRRLTYVPDRNDPSLKSFAEDRFQNQPALTNLYNAKRFTVREAMFKRGDDWYDVGVSLPDAEVIRIDQWWRFAESFKATAQDSAKTTH